MSKGKYISRMALHSKFGLVSLTFSDFLEFSSGFHISHERPGPFFLLRHFLRPRPSAPLLARRGLTGFFLVDYTQTDGAPLFLSREESVGLFRLMNLGVSGESGLASKQIRGKISVRRRRRTDGTTERWKGRRTDGRRTVIWKRFTEEPSLRKNHSDAPGRGREGSG